jgi:flavin reductase (DIM6/NTAB) family NADH-FMN oxidoreductase RutF
MMSKIEVSPDLSHRLVSGGVVALVTAEYKGRANVMAAAWVTPLSHEPLLLAVSVHPARYTHGLIKRSGAFILNLPGRPRLEKVHKCGTLSGREVDDKFAAAGLTQGAGRRVDAPWVEECLAHVECGLVEAIELGDHTLFVGEVVGAWAEETAFSESWTLVDEEVKPLCHLGKNLYAVPEERLEVVVDDG